MGLVVEGGLAADAPRTPRILPHPPRVRQAPPPARAHPLPEPDSVQPDQAAVILVFERNTEPGRNTEALSFASRHPAAPGRKSSGLFWRGSPRTPPRHAGRDGNSAPRKTEQVNAKQSCPSCKSCNPVENAEQGRLVAEEGNPKPTLFPTGEWSDLDAKRSSRPLCSPPPLCLQTPAPVRHVEEDGRNRRCARIRERREAGRRASSRRGARGSSRGRRRRGRGGSRRSSGRGSRRRPSRASARRRWRGRCSRSGPRP